MKNQTQQIAMYMALGAAITMLVLYFSGQLKFVEFLEGEPQEEEGGAEEYEEGEEDGVEAYESDSDSDSDSEDEGK
jgi:hypothetical protein